MSDVVEAWMWRDPQEIVDRLIARHASKVARGERISPRPPQERDRYYTQARKLHVKQLMKGKI